MIRSQRKDGLHSDRKLRLIRIPSVTSEFICGFSSHGRGAWFPIKPIVGRNDFLNMASFERRLRTRVSARAPALRLNKSRGVVPFRYALFPVKLSMYKTFVHFRIPLWTRLNRKLVKFSPANMVTDASLAPSTRPPTAIPPQVNTLSDGRLEYVDIGVNLGDPVFQGMYHGKRAHESDLEDVIQRATAAGCLKMMITGSDLEQSKIAIKLAEDYRTCNYRMPGWLCISISFSARPLHS